MAAAVVRHAGARFVVVTDVNEFRLDLARKMKVDLAVNVTQTSIADVQKKLGMSEGFDVALEMSGNPAAFRDIVRNMAHGGRVAVLGIPSGEFAMDWREIIFNMLTIQGIYGRRMYESWYKMTVLLQAGLDIRPVITHRFSYRDFQNAFDVMRSGNSGKVILNWEELR
jgi:threonine 3-dehydrogenase